MIRLRAGAHVPGTTGRGSQLKRSAPFLLTTFRLLLGPLALVCAIEGAPRIIYLPILVAGTLSDIFDGILARRLHVATPFLRRYDSVTDMIYYLFLLAVVWKLCAPVLHKTIWAIAILLISEAACIAVSFARFRRYPAAHTYLAKFYGLALLAAVIALLVFNASAWVVVALMIVGVVTNAEILIIHFAVKSPPVDVKSVFALRRREA
jgi:phosphatidylglycerophosphate synthase